MLISQEIEKTIENIELVLALDHAGRAGNNFFQASFDHHEEVLGCPWVHYVNSYMITDLGECNTYNTSVAHEYWTKKSYYRFIYNDLDEEMSEHIYKYGSDPTAALDREIVRKSFDEFVLTKDEITRKELIWITYISYAFGVGKDINKVRYILVNDSVSLKYENVLSGYSGKIIDFVIKDYNEPKIVHLIRDPRAGFASTRHQFMNSVGNMYGIKIGNYWNRYLRILKLDYDWDSVFVFAFWLMYFSQTFRASQLKKNKYNSLFVELKIENLNIDYYGTLLSLCEWLDVQPYDGWKKQPYKLTMLNKPWKGISAYDSAYQPFLYGPLQNDPEKSVGSASPNISITRSWKKRLWRNELFIIEYLMRDELSQFGYDFLEFSYTRDTAKSFIWNWIKPFRGELPTISWIFIGRKIGLLEFTNRLFYTLSFPLFYVFGRLTFIYILYKKDVFEMNYSNQD